MGLSARGYYTIQMTFANSSLDGIHGMKLLNVKRSVMMFQFRKKVFVCRTVYSVFDSRQSIKVREKWKNTNYILHRENVCLRHQKNSLHFLYLFALITIDIFFGSALFLELTYSNYWNILIIDVAPTPVCLVGSLLSLSYDEWIFVSVFGKFDICIHVELSSCWIILFNGNVREGKSTVSNFISTRVIVTFFGKLCWILTCLSQIIQ